MPAKKPNSPPGPKKLSEKQIRRIWTEMKAPVLYEQIRNALPGNKWTLSGFRISGCCPFHDDNSPSFHIYLDRGYAKCFGCDKYIWNPIELWAKIKGCPHTDALNELRTMFNVSFLSATAANQLKQWERNQLVKRRICELAHAELLAAIAQKTEEKYKYAQPAATWLVDERGLGDTVIHTLDMLGVLPPVAEIMSALDKEAIEINDKLRNEALMENKKFNEFISLAEDARAYLKDVTGWAGSVLFRLDLAPGVIGRLKLRRPRTHDSIDYVFDAFDDEGVGFFGLDWKPYSALLGRSQKYVWPYLVEGEFDVLTPMIHQVVTGGPTYFIIGSGGKTTTQHLDDLASIGFEEIYLVGDSPEGNGEALIQGWLPSITKLRAKVFDGWHLLPGSKDPDDAIHRHKYPLFQQLLLDTKNHEIFKTPQDWAFERAQPEIESVDPTDVRYRIVKAANWGQLLRNAAERDTFVAKCVSVYTLPEAALKREIVASGEDEPAFIMRLADALTQQFFVIGQQALDNDRRLYLWHKTKQHVVQISLADDKSIERELGAVLGPAYQFFNEKVGLPPFLEPRDEQKQGIYLQKLDTLIRWYYRQALILLAQDKPDFMRSEHMGQGIHVVRAKDDGPPTVYVVNGRDVYKGVYPTEGFPLWQKLDGPSDNGIIFDVGINHIEKPWLDTLTNVLDLKAAEKFDIHKLHQELTHVLDIGWRFKNHSITVEFMAAHLLATTICNAYSRQPVVGFHADTKAGKSKLMMGLIGGAESKSIHLIAVAKGMSTFSTAGLKQSSDAQTRPICLDEFEDEGGSEKQERAVRETLTMLRGLVGESALEPTQGTRHGEARMFHLNYFVFLAAINKPRGDADLNRIITLEMDRDDNHDDPVDILAREIGQERLTQMKHELALCMLPHMTTVLSTYKEIVSEYGKAHARPAGIDSRYFNGLHPAIATLRLLDLNYKRFATAFCDANRETIRTVASRTKAQDIEDWLLDSPNLELRMNENRERKKMSLRSILATPEGRLELNVSGTGVYVDEETGIVFVNWVAALQTVMREHLTFSRETHAHNMRDLANRSPGTLKTAEILRSPAYHRMKPLFLNGVNLANVTAYNFAHLIGHAKPKPLSTPEEPQAPAKVEDNGDFDAA